MSVTPKFSGNTKLPASVEAFDPRNGKILILRDERPTHDGAIELANAPQQHTGEVLKVANDECGYEVGERVLIASYAGSNLEFSDSDREYVLMDPDQIYGVIS